MNKDKVLRALNAAILELENIKQYYPQAEVNTHILDLLKKAYEIRKEELDTLSKQSVTFQLNSRLVYNKLTKGAYTMKEVILTIVFIIIATLIGSPVLMKVLQMFSTGNGVLG